jgi:hypothetical protein
MLHERPADFRVLRNAKAKAANVQVHEFVLMCDAEGFIRYCQVVRQTDEQWREERQSIVSCRHAGARSPFPFPGCDGLGARFAFVSRILVVTAPHEQIGNLPMNRSESNR